jgi:hypothetical protein
MCLRRGANLRRPSEWFCVACHPRASRFREQVDPWRMVFIDESWAKTNMAPLRGWAPRGERLKAKDPMAITCARRRATSGRSCSLAFFLIVRDEDRGVFLRRRPNDRRLTLADCSRRAA